MIGPNVSLITSGHPPEPSQRRAGVVVKPIVIGENVWISACVIIIGAVTGLETATMDPKGHFRENSMRQGSANWARRLRMLSLSWIALVFVLIGVEYLKEDNGVFVYRRGAIASQGYQFGMPDGKTYVITQKEREEWVSRERDVILNGAGTFFRPKSSSMTALNSIPPFMGFHIERILGFMLAGAFILNFLAVHLEKSPTADVDS